MTERSELSLQALPALARQYLRDLWDLRWRAAAVSWIVGLLAIPAVMLVPNQYEASTKIFVDTQTVLKPLMAGLAVQPDIDQQVRMMARVVVTRPNVERLLERPDLRFTLAGDTERELYIQQLMKKIKFEPSGFGSTNLYEISYRDIDPARSKKVVESILDIFVQSNINSKKHDAEEAGEFIEEQIRSYEAKLTEAEERLKNFKIKNYGISGVSNQDFFVRLSALVEEVSKLQVELNAAEQSRDAYRRELAEEDPQLPPDSPLATAGVVPAGETRLEAQKKQLDELLRRYTEAHPDVVAARRVISQLEAQKRREAEERAAAIRAGTAKPAATSPVYQKIRVSLAEVEAQVASLRTQLGAKRASLEQLRAVAGRMPQVEAEYAQLNRDYDVMRKNYESLVTRRESAAMGRRLDESSRLADFRIVEPPHVKEKAVFPARIHAAVAAAIAALLVGLASPILWDLFKPTFKDAKSLRLGISRPLLGVVSLAQGSLQRRSGALEQIGLALSVVGFVVLQAGWLVWLATRSSAF